MPTLHDVVGRLARSAVTLAIAAAFAAGPARGEDMDAQVARLVRTYRESSTKPQDIAAKLQAAAEGLANDAPLRRAMHEAAYEYGLKGAAGYVTAAAAAESMIFLDGGGKPDWFEKLVDVQALRYRRSSAKDKAAAASDYVDALLRSATAEEAAGRVADARKRFQLAYRVARAGRMDVAKMIPLRLKALDARQRVERLLGQSRRLVEKDPEDTRAAATLVRILLCEMDDPAAASKHLSEAAGEAQRTYIPLACRPIEQMNETQCDELAKWYAELAKTASECGKPRMLARTVGYLERYLALHAQQDVPHLTAKDLLSRAAKQMNDYPWLGVYGVLVGNADDEFTLYRNGQQIARSQGNCKPSKPVNIRLMPGDLLCAKLYNMMYGCRFWLSLESGGARRRITSGRWRDYKPADPKRWWQMSPRASDLPCVDKGGGQIWGRGKDKNTWVYRVLTEQDFAAFSAPAAR